MIFGDLFPREAIKFLLLKTISYRWHDSIIFHEFVSPQPDGGIFKNCGIPAHLILDISFRWSSRTPVQHRPVIVGQMKDGGHMQILATWHSKIARYFANMCNLPENMGSLCYLGISCCGVTPRRPAFWRWRRPRSRR
jgi:hypothetical protein